MHPQELQRVVSPAEGTTPMSSTLQPVHMTTGSRAALFEIGSNGNEALTYRDVRSHSARYKGVLREYSAIPGRSSAPPSVELRSQ